MDKARKLGSFKNFVVGRCSETTVSHAFEKHSAILRYLGSIDANGEVHVIYPPKLYMDKPGDL
jgi:hypothetical protein